jgi:sugar lactone lactonase YvrE
MAAPERLTERNVIDNYTVLMRSFQPMTSVEIIDPLFATYVLGNAPIKQLATGFDWVEGPVWFGDPQHSCIHDCAADGALSSWQHFHTEDPGASDRFCSDTDGNLWSSAADGVHCIASGGRLRGKILVPELVPNICFVGCVTHELYIKATASLFHITLNRQGAQHP